MRLKIGCESDALYFQLTDAASFEPEEVRPGVILDFDEQGRMEQWEYWTGFIWANAEDKDVKEFLKNRSLNWSPPKHAPQAMMPEINTCGEQGWELVHMEPVSRWEKLRRWFPLWRFRLYAFWRD